jgi:acyl carrier protein
MDSVESALREIRSLMIEKVGAVVDLNDDLPLGPTGVGLDSVAMVELLLACEERFGLVLRDDLLDEFLTPRALARAVLGPAG